MKIHKHQAGISPRITQRREQVLDFIQTYSRKHGMPPNLREIGVGVGLSSSSTVWTHCQSLVKLGMLVYVKSSPRSYRIKGQTPKEGWLDLCRAELALASLTEELRGLLTIELPEAQAEALNDALEGLEGVARDMRDAAVPVGQHPGDLAP